MSQSLILRGDANSDLELVDKFLANLRKSIVDARAAGVPVAIGEKVHSEPVNYGFGEFGAFSDFRYMGTTFTISIPPPRPEAMPSKSEPFIVTSPAR